MDIEKIYLINNEWYYNFFKIDINVVILSTLCGDWETLYINGLLIDEGHHIGEGDRLYLLKQAEKYNFKWQDVRIHELAQEDDEYVEDNGFPTNITEFKGKY